MSYKRKAAAAALHVYRHRKAYSHIAKKAHGAYKRRRRNNSKGYKKRGARGPRRRQLGAPDSRYTLSTASTSMSDNALHEIWHCGRLKKLADGSYTITKRFDINNQPVPSSVNYKGVKIECMLENVSSVQMGYRMLLLEDLYRSQPNWPQDIQVGHISGGVHATIDAEKDFFRGDVVQDPTDFGDNLATPNLRKYGAAISGRYRTIWQKRGKLAPGRAYIIEKPETDAPIPPATTPPVLPATRTGAPTNLNGKDIVNFTKTVPIKTQFMYNHNTSTPRNRNIRLFIFTTPLNMWHANDSGINPVKIDLKCTDLFRAQTYNNQD